VDRGPERMLGCLAALSRAHLDRYLTDTKPCSRADNQRLDRVPEILRGQVLSEQRDRPRPGCLESARDVGEADSHHAAEYGGEHPHRPLAGPPNTIVAFAREARSDHQVSLVEAGYEGSDLSRIVLAVGVDLNEHIEAVISRVAKPCPHRAADAEVERQAENDRTGIPRTLRRCIRRA